MPKITIEYPFTPALSENRRLNWNPKTHRMFANRAYMRAKETLAVLIELQAKKEKFCVNAKLPVCVRMTVEKPNRRFDASNFVKPVNDAIAEALTGRNDNLFYGSYDWAINKFNPCLNITIEQ